MAFYWKHRIIDDLIPRLGTGIILSNSCIKGQISLIARLEITQYRTFFLSYPLLQEDINVLDCDLTTLFQLFPFPHCIMEISSRVDGYR